jgi:type IV pilus assembly protein PilV
MSVILTKQQRGFTLIEVMVAFLIMGVALLGLASMQSSGLQVNQSAYNRTQAAVLAMDMAEKIRANRGQSIDQLYEGETGAQVGSCMTAAGCSLAEMRQNDVYEWKQAIANVLPGGDGVICFDMAASANDGSSATDPGCSGVDGDGNPLLPNFDGVPVYTIKIWWHDTFSDDENANQRHVLSIKP